MQAGRINSSVQPSTSRPDSLDSYVAAPSKWSGRSVKVALAGMLKMTKWGRETLEAESNSRANRAVLASLATSVREAGIQDRDDIKQQFRELSKWKITLPTSEFKEKVSSFEATIPKVMESTYAVGQMIGSVVEGMATAIEAVASEVKWGFGFDGRVQSKATEMAVQALLNAQGNADSKDTWKPEKSKLSRADAEDFVRAALQLVREEAKQANLLDTRR